MCVSCSIHHRYWSVLLDSKLLFTIIFSEKLKLLELLFNDFLYFFNLCLMTVYRRAETCYILDSKHYPVEL